MFKDIFKVGSTNIIKMLVSLLVAFVLPKILTVDDYGFFKLYQFYVTYIGISHLGFCDGIYLKYGGKQVKEIDPRKISTEFTSILLFEFFISAVFIIIGIVIHDFIIISLGLVALPMIMTTFMSFVYQATGEFSRYSKILSTSYFLNFIAFGALLILRVELYIPYVIVAIAVEFCSFMMFLISSIKLLSLKISKPSIQCLTKTMKLGILLTLGNIIYALFIGVDKWFIKFTLPFYDFTMYSFAGQMITVVNMVVTPISLTLYNYFCKRKDQDFEVKVKRLIVLLLMLMPVLIYCINFVIFFFLPQYAGAEDAASILIITQIFWGINTAIFVNLYKVYKQQKQYLIRMTISLGIAVILDACVMLICPGTTGYAFATLITTVIYLIINTAYFKYLKPSIKETLFIIILLAVYVATLQLPLLYKLIIYLLSYVILSIVLMRVQLMQCIGFLSSIKARRNV